MTNKLITAEWAKDALRAHVENQIRQYEWMVRKGWIKSLEQLRAEWAARPWHERARINTMNWIRAKRIKLGELIAGREFNDDY
jgi:hypothetical protein